MSNITASLSHQGSNHYKIQVDWGQKSTGGYHIKITSAIYEVDTLYLNITTTSPGPNAMVTQVISYPKDAMDFEHPQITVDTRISLIVNGQPYQNMSLSEEVHE